MLPKRTYKERLKRRNDLATFIEIMGRVAEKEFTRDELRDYCKENLIYFALRHSKQRLAKQVIKDALEKENPLVLETIESACTHWQNKITSGDRHKPDYYKMMLSLAKRARGLYQELQKEI